MSWSVNWRRWMHCRQRGFNARVHRAEYRSVEDAGPALPVRIGPHGIGDSEELLDVSPFELADTQDVATGKLHALHPTFALSRCPPPDGLYS